jgi:hypothetical protein
MEERMKKVVVVVAVMLLFSAVTVAADLQVTFYSIPFGATLIEGGRVLGPTPFTLKYKLPKDWKKGNCVTLNPVTVKWVSGAVSTLDNFTACAKDGNDRTFHFQRPASFPGAEIDTEYATQLSQLEIGRQQLALAKEQRDREYWEAQQRSMQQSLENARFRPRPTLRCTSMVVDIFVYTNCR